MNTRPSTRPISSRVRTFAIIAAMGTLTLAAVVMLNGNARIHPTLAYFSDSPQANMAQGGPTTSHAFSCLSALNDPDIFQSWALDDLGTGYASPVVGNYGSYMANGPNSSTPMQGAGGGVPANSSCIEDPRNDGAYNYIRVSNVSGTPGYAGFVASGPIFQSHGTAGNYWNEFSLSIWWRSSTASSSGTIMLMRGTQSVSYENGGGALDRRIYVDQSGRIGFGVYTPAAHVQIVRTANGVDYSNGQWHHIVASLSSAGMKLWVDGSDETPAGTMTIPGTGQTAPYGPRLATEMTSAYQYPGGNAYWIVGNASTSSQWPDAPGLTVMGGDFDNVSIWKRMLSTAEIQDLYRAQRVSGDPNP